MLKKRYIGRMISVFAAVAIACTQMLGIMPLNAAAENDEVTLQTEESNDDEAILWTDETSLPTSGKYKLGCDVETDRITVSDRLDLDLNGKAVRIEQIVVDGECAIRDSCGILPDKGIKGTTYESLFEVNGKLDVYGAYIIAYNALIYGGVVTQEMEDNTKPTIKLNDNSVFNLYNGYIHSYYGIAIYVGANATDVNLMGGYVSGGFGNIIYDTTGKFAAVYIDKGYSGKINLNGVWIGSCTSGIYTESSTGILNISDAYIRSDFEYGINCKANMPINLNGKLAIKAHRCGISLVKGQKINIVGKIDVWNFDVCCDESGVFTDGFSKYCNSSELIDYISLINTKCKVYLDKSGELYMDQYDDMRIYLTLIDDNNNIILADESIYVKDLNNDGAIWGDEMLYCAHEQHYSGGAALGYNVIVGQDGKRDVEKLWGKKCNNAWSGYQASFNDLLFGIYSRLYEGDKITVFIYKDKNELSDILVKGFIEDSYLYELDKTYSFSLWGDNLPNQKFDGNDF
ncbi:MAG: hypothetical protein K5898_12870 [Ruminococcus sp.]|uniref:hypothetical protein n=1 Tax=Ruminococcus sp. TaxID=41978 RepID=UPI0025F99F08|nr:hypothetical protein [Ruminococcus sp.]MCR4796032.1 hypothetical protein [Ruminococcus sp.]